MNAIPFPRALLPAPNGDAAYSAACAVHADQHIGKAMDLLSEAVGAVCGQRRTLTEAEHKALVGMRNAMVALSHARNLLEPLMVERPL